MRAEGAQMHWYMATVSMVCLNRMGPNEGGVPEDQIVGTRNITTNILVTPKRKRITASVINDIRQTGLVKARDKYKVDVEKDLSDMAILNIVYLGLMTEKDYNDMSVST